MSDVLDRLGALGAQYRDPMDAIPWENADPDLPWLPDSVLSLAGTALGAAMTPEMRARFSRVEFARLCAAGLWLGPTMTPPRAEPSSLVTTSPVSDTRLAKVST